MGSTIKTNDTLQITTEQGFPVEFNYEKHLVKPLVAEEFSEKIFTFQNKDGIRIYQTPPVRNFLVQNINNKWLYWGLVHIIEVTHDYIKKTTSGKFKIIYIYSPEEMKQAYNLIDRDKETNFLEFL